MSEQHTIYGQLIYKIRITLIYQQINICVYDIFVYLESNKRGSAKCGGEVETFASFSLDEKTVMNI